MSLEKATLTRLANDASDREEGDPIPVQFNPASLRLTLTNNTEGGQNTGRPQRQLIHAVVAIGQAVAIALEFFGVS